jgi:hypothetical protein
VKEWAIRQLQKIARRVLDPMIEPLRRDIARISWPQPDIKNPIAAAGRRYFSQNDEDGILLEIIKRANIQPATFLEIGVGDGLECNSIILLALGWRGAWVSGQPLAFEPGKRLAFKQAWITRENVAQLSTEALNGVGVSKDDVKVVSIDLDGNDSHILRSVLADGYRPDVFILEYNSKFPPNVGFEIQYDSEHRWAFKDYMGASLFTLAKILPDYKLVACNANGVNAFFVSDRIASHFADVPDDIADIYRPGSYGEYPPSGHRTDGRTVQLLSGR